MRTVPVLIALPRQRRRRVTQAGEPHSLVSAGRRWYFVAWDVDRADWRTFRVDRIASPLPIGLRCPPRDLPAAFVIRSLALARPVQHVELLVHASAAELADRFRVRTAEVQPLDENTCLLRTTADSLEWTALRIAHLDLPFEVRDPPEMADHLRTLAAKLLRAAGDPA
ncbi:WYL domain-containing protein [Nocardia sp. bgisy118]|uniref:WYL domain-containing protein n=1 Tax=Nocardia sp. bgisy118 TaxID=3413786 RepID=UPI003F4A8190